MERENMAFSHFDRISPSTENSSNEKSPDRSQPNFE